jgi:hypothetical protein
MTLMSVSAYFLALCTVMAGMAALATTALATIPGL